MGDKWTTTTITRATITRQGKRRRTIDDGIVVIVVVKGDMDLDWTEMVTD